MALGRNGIFGIAAQFSLRHNKREFFRTFKRVSFSFYLLPSSFFATCLSHLFGRVFALPHLSLWKFFLCVPWNTTISFVPNLEMRFHSNSVEALSYEQKCFTDFLCFLFWMFSLSDLPKKPYWMHLFVFSCSVYVLFSVLFVNFNCYFPFKFPKY